MTEYFVNAMVWSALGLTVGIIIGMGIRVKYIGKPLDRQGRDRLAGAILILIALISTAQSLVFQRHQSEVQDCQTRYNIAFQKSLKERAATTDRDRKNLTDTLAGILASTDRAQSRSILEEYVKTNKKLTEEREASKLPTKTGASCR